MLHPSLAQVLTTAGAAFMASHQAEYEERVKIETAMGDEFEDPPSPPTPEEQAIATYTANVAFSDLKAWVIEHLDKIGWFEDGYCVPPNEVELVVPDELLDGLGSLAFNLLQVLLTNALKGTEIEFRRVEGVWAFVWCV